ncbi:hypothetical protein B0H11DRAFT_2268225 [Mycena galericulata]|nr:hypothetical protein B0H11DRAFT_2268225 [Mycena galericulata]
MTRHNLSLRPRRRLGAEMDRVTHAIEALKKVSSTHKKDAIQTPIGELNSVLHLLKLSSSDKVLKTLSKLFTDKFRPLYEPFPAQMLHFCATVLAEIYREKVRPACDAQDFSIQLSWETVMKSIVSAVLDFLESKPSKSSRTAAANALYTTLCDMCYPQKVLFQWQSPTLVFNINMLLAETLAEHPENQSLLRSEKVLGAKRLGSALSLSKDFFVIDSLLAFMGPLLPSRQVASKRAEFVDAVFAPSLFPRSDQIKRLIAASTGTDWDPVATQIINDCLAKSDISFPQPFYVTALRTNTPLPNIVDPLYVDKKGLFANTEENGVFDSYQVPFESMERIKLGAPSLFDTPVAIYLCAEPLVGASPETQMKKCNMMFQVKTPEVARFVEALKARGLDQIISEAERKVSKLAEGLSLEFNSNGRKPPTQQEKVAKVQQLWLSNDRGLAEPTSPLVAQSSKESARGSEAEASSQHDAIDGDDLSDLSDHEAPVAKPQTLARAASPAASSPRARVRIALHSEDEDGAVVQQPRKALPRKSALKKKTRVVVVDSEEEEEEDTGRSDSPTPANTMDRDFEPTQEPGADANANGPPPAARLTRGAAKKGDLAPAFAESEAGVVKPTVAGRAGASAAAAVRDTVPADAPPPVRSIRRTAKKAAPIDVQLSEDEIEPAPMVADAKPSPKASTDAAGATKHSRGKGDAASLAKVKAETATKATDAKNERKRTRGDDDQGEDALLNKDADPRPTKRLRPITTDAAPEEAPPRRVSAAVFGAVNAAPAKKRYGGKKGRASSPSADAPATDMAIDFDELPSRHSPSPAPVAEKAAKAPRQEAGVGKSRVAAMKGKAGQKPVAAKSEPAAAKAPPKPRAAPADKKKSKTHTAAAKKEMEDVEENADTEAKPARRSTRAAKANVPSKPAEPPIVAATEPKPKPEKPRKAPWEDMHLRNDADVAPSDEPAESEPFEEYDVPLKGSAYSDPPAPVPQDDVTMIDLTQDPSPQAKPDKQTHFDVASPAAIVVTSVRSVDALPALPVVDSILPSVSHALVNVQCASPAKIDSSTPRRSSPVAKPEPLLPLSMTKFKSEGPLRPIKPVSFLQKVPSPSSARPSKLPSPAKQPTPPKFVRPRDTPTLCSPYSPIHQVAPSPPSPARSAPRKVNDDSPFPERTYHTVTFAPSRASPSPSAAQRENFHKTTSAPWAANNHGGRDSSRTGISAYERTPPDFGRPVRHTFVRGPQRHEADERDYEHKRSRSPTQGIIEVLNEIQRALVEKITRRFEHVRNDVRIGRDGILRGAAASLETMCTESEGHFNNLVDLEEEYAGYHRKIIVGIDDWQKSAEVMSSALGQIIQHHDRRSLSKKLPTTLFALPSIVRNPVLTL